MTSLTFPGHEDGVAAEVGDLHHHAIVHHAVGGFQPAVNADVTGVQVRHALAKTDEAMTSSQGKGQVRPNPKYNDHFQTYVCPTINIIFFSHKT